MRIRAFLAQGSRLAHRIHKSVPDGCRDGRQTAWFLELRAVSRRAESHVAYGLCVWKRRVKDLSRDALLAAIDCGRASYPSGVPVGSP